MWRSLFNGFRRLLIIQEMLERHEREINELRHGLRTLSASVEELRHEMRHFTDNERHEREKFFLRVENAFLGLERRLAPPSAGGKRRRHR